MMILCVAVVAYAAVVVWLGRRHPVNTPASTVRSPDVVTIEPDVSEFLAAMRRATLAFQRLATMLGQADGGVV